MNTKSHGKINVIGNENCKKKIQDITSTCAEVVGSTIGPYGKNTILQTSDGVIKTKDGWNVLKGLKFDSLIDNSIKGIVEEIASQVVLKVGDGSTTSIVAASIMNELLGNYLSTKPNYSTRELDTALRKSVNLIIDQLNDMSIKIETEELKEFMYKIALVSTNWDHDTSNMVAEIISTTNNPIIKIEYSGTDSTEITINQDTYDVTGELVDKLFINNKETSSCEMDKPIVLVFDHTVKEDYIPLFLTYYTSLLPENRNQILILAPEFTDTFKTEYNRYLMASINHQNTIPYIVPVKYIRATNFDRLCMKDFAMMCGGSLITKSDDLTTLVKKAYSPSSEDELEDGTELIEKIYKYLSQFKGECNSAEITNKLITIGGFYNRNADEYERVLATASHGLGEKLREHTAMSMLTDDVKLRKHRLGKLQCKMGTIKLGGFGQADLKAKKDALDDATLACEAAYYNGYNIGSSMAVPTACHKLIVLNEDLSLSDLERAIVCIISNTFVDVFKKILSNKCNVENYKSCEGFEYKDIITKCIMNGVGYDIINDIHDYDRQIINPTTTDIEVLKGMLNIILLNFTSNQLLFKHFEDDLV